MTIKELMKLTSCYDYDIADEISDFYNCFVVNENEGDNNDSYDRLMDLFASSIEAVKVCKNGAMLVKLTEYINEHIEAFNKFMNEENKDCYKPKNYIKQFTIDDEGFYDLYINTMASLINGNYCDKDYTKLYNYLRA